MRFKIITSEQNKLEIEKDQDIIIVKETEDGKLSITFQSVNKDMKIIHINSNNVELEFVERGE